MTALQPGCEEMEREWGNEEEMEREWGNGERFTLYISLYLFPPPLSISYWVGVQSLAEQILFWCSTHILSGKECKVWYPKDRLVHSNNQIVILIKIKASSKAWWKPIDKLSKDPKADPESGHKVHGDRQINRKNVYNLQFEQIHMCNGSSHSQIRTFCKVLQRTSREFQQETQNWSQGKVHRDRQSQRWSPTKSSLAASRILEQNI